MSDAYTVVFHGHPQNVPGNPFNVETPFGTVVSVGIGNAFEDADCFRTALETIADRGGSREASIAQDALDERDAVLMTTLDAWKAARPVAELNTTEDAK